MPTFHLAQPVNAPRNVVWRACSTPAGLRAWQGDEVIGSMREGETILLHYKALGAAVELQVVSVVPERKIVLQAGPHSVTFTIGDGGVTLAHSELPAGDEYAGAGSAWAVSLATLAHYCEYHSDRERNVFWLVGHAQIDAATAHVFFSEAAPLAAWLGQSGTIGPTGSPVSISLGKNVQLTGNVLAHTPERDLLLSWKEDGDSLLAMRTLPSPRSTRERMVILTWSRWAHQAPLEGAWPLLQAAHHRLLGLLSAPSA